MKNTRLFKLKYVGPTNTKGSRVSIHDLRFHKRRMISYDYSFSNIADIASYWLQDKGIACSIQAETPDGHILGTDDFSTQI